MFGVPEGWHWTDTGEGTAGRAVLCQTGSFPPEKRSPLGFGSGWWLWGSFVLWNCISPLDYLKIQFSVWPHRAQAFSLCFWPAGGQWQRQEGWGRAVGNATCLPYWEGDTSVLQHRTIVQLLQNTILVIMECLSHKRIFQKHSCLFIEKIYGFIPHDRVLFWIACCFLHFLRTCCQNQCSPLAEHQLGEHFKTGYVRVFEVVFKTKCSAFINDLGDEAERTFSK